MQVFNRMGNQTFIKLISERIIIYGTPKFYFLVHESQLVVLIHYDLTFRHRASSILDRRFANLQRTLFAYLINKYISLSDICLNVHH